MIHGTAEDLHIDKGPSVTARSARAQHLNQSSFGILVPGDVSGVAHFVNLQPLLSSSSETQTRNNPIQTMLAALDSGYSLILFPEGTRGEPEIEQPLKKGIGILLSQRPSIKFIPAYMTGMGKAMPKDDNLIVPFKSTLTYGEPCEIESHDIDEIVKQIERHFKELKQKTAKTV